MQVAVIISLVVIYGRFLLEVHFNPIIIKP